MKNISFRSEGSGSGKARTRVYAFFLGIILIVSCTLKRDSLVIVYPSAPRSFDCHLRRELITLSILNNIYESLVGFDANMKLIPLLADYWERSDSLTWIFYLRDNISFHNGERCGLADVIYSLYRPRYITESEFKQLHIVLDTILGEEPNMIIVKTRSPRTFVPYDLALIGIIPQGYDPNHNEPIGTGPYRFLESDGEKITLEAFDDYWGRKPQIKKVYFYVAPEFDDRFRMLIEGRAHIITYVPIDRVKECEDVGRVLASPGVSTRYLEFNLGNFPFSNRQFRTALAIGIDREKFAKDVYHGYAVPANQYVNPGVFGYDPTRPHFRYDPDSARRLIEGLGPLPVINLEFANVKYFIGEAFAKELENIGLRVKICSLPPDQFWIGVEQRQSDCYLISTVPNSYEGINDLISGFHTLRPNQGLGLQNRVGYSNHRVDSLLESLPLILDRRTVAQQISEVQNILLTDLPSIPIVWEKQIYCVPRNIDLDWVLRLDEFILVKDIRIVE